MRFAFVVPLERTLVAVAAYLASPLTPPPVGRGLERDICWIRAYSLGAGLLPLSSCG
ncbi:hypothetical protein HMPREF9080_00899 [Cardiobacterium valvarum F0432]|uniref:Uncharacterized protein n=1 Tax=Cardiobacterium valvarum F0432 TaxID=797473 RepID=G9ZDR5_9GAMM|nr:hypothetical protein HMPREF9080_00899 [Cardiobacterium valvarum F0432]